MAHFQQPKMVTPDQKKFEYALLEAGLDEMSNDTEMECPQVETPPKQVVQWNRSAYLQQASAIALPPPIPGQGLSD